MRCWVESTVKRLMYLARCDSLSRQACKRRFAAASAFMPPLRPFLPFPSLPFPGAHTGLTSGEKAGVAVVVALVIVALVGFGYLRYRERDVHTRRASSSYQSVNGRQECRTVQRESLECQVSLSS